MGDVTIYGYIFRHLVLPLLCSVCVSTVLTYFIRAFTHKVGLLDKPGEHKQHEAPTPTLGGIPVFVAFVVGCWMSGPMTDRLLCLIQASTLLVAVGVWDDIWGVRAKLKLSTLFLATFWLWKHGIQLEAFGLPGPLALILTFLWIGLVSSAFNGVDNADGAAGGLALCSAITAFAISWQSWQHDLATISLVLGGSCFGFLIFNFPWPRATIFLGDSGSLFLGFGLSALTVVGEWSSLGWKSACIALLLVFVPLFDFLFILISRGLDGRYRNWEDPIKMCGRDHLSHRLRYLGLSSRQSLFVLYLLGAICGRAAYCIAVNPNLLNPASAVSALGAVLLLGMGFKLVKLPEGAFPEG